MAIVLVTDTAYAQRTKGKKSGGKKTTTKGKGKGKKGKGEKTTTVEATPEAVKEPERPKLPDPNPDPYKRQLNSQRDPVAYERLRESDVMWQRKVWRMIDLREKINHPLYYPFEPINGRRCLAQVLVDALSDGKITAYGGLSDELSGTVVLTSDEIKAMFAGKPDTVRLTSPFTGNDTTIVNPGSAVSYDKITGFQIKEDWIFDKHRSVQEARIMAVRPIMNAEIKDSDGNVISSGIKAMFWVDFREIRKVLVENEVFNRKNDANRLTFDDVFTKRDFSSYIYKSTLDNPYDRILSEYLEPVEALIESDNIRDGIMIYEHDLWEY